MRTKHIGQTHLNPGMQYLRQTEALLLSGITIVTDPHARCSLWTPSVAAAPQGLQNQCSGQPVWPGSQVSLTVICP
jgi:hypothetical protein